MRSSIVSSFHRFARDRRGNVMVMFVLFFVPLVFCCGGAIDYARALQFRTVLQGATDAAALAGAIEYVNASDGNTAVGVATNYMTVTIQNMPSGANGSFTVTPGVTTTPLFMSRTQRLPSTICAGLMPPEPEGPEGEVGAWPVDPDVEDWPPDPAEPTETAALPAWPEEPPLVAFQHCEKRLSQRL